MPRLTRLQLLGLALSGVRLAIAIHPRPRDYPEEIEEYERHRDTIVREINRIMARTPLARELSPREPA